MESFWNQVEKKNIEEIKIAGELLESSSGSKGKIKEERMKEWGASGKWSCGSKEKEKGKGEDVDKIMYTCVVDKIQEEKKEKKKEKETYGGKKKRQRIRNHNLKILPQYFHNIFTINFK